MQFALFDAAGAPVGVAITVASVQVVNGIFTVSLDFGAPAFPANMERLLEIRVFNPTTAAYVPLSPRQPLTSAPFSIRALNATTADVSTNTLQVGGTPAAQIIKEGDPRLTDTRTPTAGSGFYIQNQNAAAQTAANFRIDGTGAADVFNAVTQFNIGGGRVLSVAGTDNTFAGFNTGTVNTGISNSFFGRNAGSMNTGGSNNSFVGRDAGRNNSTGATNSFFGVNAGLNNVSGSENVFLGVQAGNSNIAGGNNTVIGTAANVGANNLTFATALGSGAVVGASNTVVLGRSADAVQIPGSFNVAGTFTANINASNIALGTLNNARLGVVPIANGGTGSATQNFVDLTTAQTVAGNKTFSGTLSGNVVNTDTQYNIIGRRGLELDSNSNLFGGDNSGQTTAGSNNTYFGVNTGGYFNNSTMGFNTTGSNNTLIGANATLGFPESNYRTAIGAGSRVINDNSIVLGRSADVVRIPGILQFNLLGAGPGNPTCRNSAGEMSFCSSSIRYKTNVAAFVSGLDLINKLRPVTFDWKVNGKRDLGFIAEEVNAVEPLLTIYNDQGEVEGLKYDRLSVAFVNAFKEQQVQIETQAKQLAEQKLLIDGLKKLVCANNPNAAVCR